MKPIKIGILGFGTVGQGTVEVLISNFEEIEKSLDQKLTLFMLASRNIKKVNNFPIKETILTDDVFEVVRHPEIDIVVELIGGSTVAKDAVLEAIDFGKHIVTANKKLLAEHGNEIFSRAEEKGVSVFFEASVAGGIPIIKILREGLAANKINWIAGIINGTSNYILTEMRDKNADFSDALSDAQKLGYAEVDPTFDIEGQDVGHKISILSALAFGTPIYFSKCYLEGISQLQGKDIVYAEELGYRIKLLAITRKVGNGIELRVHPTLIPESKIISQVDGVMNAVYIHSNILGHSFYYGAGAGSLPTASAVVADIIDIGREIIENREVKISSFSSQIQQSKEILILDINEIKSSYYLRMLVSDESGVLSELTNIFARNKISIESIIQKSSTQGEHAEIVILTHSIIEHQIKHVIAEVEQLSTVYDKVVMIRMEPLAV